MGKKSVYICQNCGAKAFQWQGQCSRCGQWGSLSLLEEEKETSIAQLDFKTRKSPNLLQEVNAEQRQGLSTGSSTVDDLFGQGLIPGSVVLLAGDPGMGKSTFLLQLAGALAKRKQKSVYISGEESLGQLKQRAKRLGVLSDTLWALSTFQVEDVLALLEEENPPSLIIVDSVQTVVSSQAEGIAGSVTQVRTISSCLLEAVKKKNTALILVGHVTKGGQIAGPKLLEHMVDTVLYLEGDKQYLFRLLRVVKNRFGPTNHVVVLQMVEQGLHIVQDPSTFFLQVRDPSLSGTALVMALDGLRPFMVEVQALVSKSFLAMPRRTALGFDTNRLNVLLAIAEKKLQINLSQMDIYAKIGGGLRLQEPSLDLGVMAAVLSSFYDRSLPEKAVFWGEVDLSGQVRPVRGEHLRLKQAVQLGYNPIICPYSEEIQRDSKQFKHYIQKISNIFDLHKYLFRRRAVSASKI